MHILVINPNTTASMTHKIGAAAQAAAAPGTEIVAVNPAFGPPSIEGYYDEVFSVPGLMARDATAGAGGGRLCHRLFRRHRARRGALPHHAPVIGIGEAAFHMASLVAGIASAW